jgi:ATP-dependent Clp protease protease subunit
MSTSPIKRDLYLHSDVEHTNVNEIVTNIHEINSNDIRNKNHYASLGMQYTPPPIRLFIDSYGGSVYQALGLIGVITTSNTPVDTYVTGVAMSAGLLIFLNGRTRYAYEYSTLLYHQLSHWNYGKLVDAEAQVIEAKRLQKIIEKIVMSRSKLTQNNLSEIYQKKTDMYYSAQDALKCGMIDVILKR